MSNFIIEITDPQISFIEIETSFINNENNIEIERYDTFNLELINTDITSINADNISTGTLNSARLPTVSPNNTSTGPSANLVSSIVVDTHGRITGYNTTTHVLATTGVKGIASFDSDNFSVSNGIVSVKTSGISNSDLINNSMIFGTTTVALGSTTNRFDHLLAISGASAVSPTTLTFCAIDGGTP